MTEKNEVPEAPKKDPGLPASVLLAYINGGIWFLNPLGGPFTHGLNIVGPLLTLAGSFAGIFLGLYAALLHGELGRHAAIFNLAVFAFSVYRVLY